VVENGEGAYGAVASLFSNVFRRSIPSRTGEMGVSSTTALVDMFGGLWRGTYLL
jgi:hypothetical protein